MERHLIKKNKLKLKETNQLQLVFLNLEHFITDLIKFLNPKQNLNLNFILREEDKFSWQFCNKGYFNFKNNIPKILTSFNLQ